MTGGKKGERQQRRRRLMSDLQGWPYPPAADPSGSHAQAACFRWDLLSACPWDLPCHADALWNTPNLPTKIIPAKIA